MPVRFSVKVPLEELGSGVPKKTRGCPGFDGEMLCRWLRVELSKARKKVETFKH